MKKASPAPEPILVRPSQMKAVMGLSRSVAYRLLRDDPKFPRLIQLSPGCVAWDVEELKRWKAALPRTGVRP